LVVITVSLINAAPIGLYGVAESIAQLVSIDPATAVTTNIGTGIDSDYDAQGLATIDDKNGIFYLIVTDSENNVLLIGLSLDDGTVTKQIPLPFSAGGFIGVGQSVNIDPTSGDIFVSGRDPSVNNQHRIYRIDMATGTLTPLATVAFIDVLGASSVYDPKNKVLWLMFGTNTSINLFGYNVTNGKLLWNINDDVYNLETMDFDPETGLIYGIGLKVINDSYASRTVVTLNSATGEFNVIAVIDKDQFWIIDGGASALDWTNRVLYCYLQPRGPESNPFDLVGVDMATGKLVNGAPAACTDPGACPWSLEYHNEPVKVYWD